MCFLNVVETTTNVTKITLAKAKSGDYMEVNHKRQDNYSYYSTIAETPDMSNKFCASNELEA